MVSTKKSQVTIVPYGEKKRRASTVQSVFSLLHITKIIPANIGHITKGYRYSSVHRFLRFYSK